MKLMILGTGEVGKACAQYLLSIPESKYCVESLILQCSTSESSKKLSKEFSSKQNVEVYSLDIFSTDGLIKLKNKIVDICPDYIIDTLPIGNILTRIYNQTSLENTSNLLFKYFEVLKESFHYGVKRIQKVSSGGAGGLGITCPYRHGISESSNKKTLLWKIFFNGALHQLLTNLHESSGASVGLTIPRALIGYEKNEIGYLVGCGDKTLYTRTELELCAAPSQFGFITKDEVVEAVFDSLFEGCLDLDMINNSCKYGVNSTFKSMKELESLTKDMFLYERKNKINILSIGSLGNSVTRDIIEVALAVDRSNNEYKESHPPFNHLLNKGYFDSHLLNHFNFLNKENINNELNINYHKSNLIKWEMNIRQYFKNTKLTTLEIGKYLSTIYQKKGVCKK